MRPWGCLWSLLVLSALGPSASHAQQDARLVEALAMARDGRADSARRIVDHLLTATPPTDSLYAEALYTAGSIASTAQEMQRFFQRISIEYAWTGWADDALLRLAQIDYAANDAAAAARTLETIRQDYPASPLLPAAAVWAARAYFDLNDSASACQWLSRGLDAVGGDIELQNRLHFYQRRCAVPAEAAALAAPSPQDPRPARGFWVQTLATRTREPADQAATRLAPLGYETRIVDEDGWFKVRVGAFADRAEAERAVARVTQAVGGSPFIVHQP